jgi:hypothetical protein
MVTSDQSRGFLLERMCSGVAPHLSDGSSAIRTVFFKSKKSSWLVTPQEYRSAGGPTTQQSTVFRGSTTKLNGMVSVLDLTSSGQV